MRVEVEAVKAYAQLEERGQLAGHIHRIAAFAQGIMAMERYAHCASMPPPPHCLPASFMWHLNHAFAQRRTQQLLGNTVQVMNGVAKCTM